MYNLVILFTHFAQATVNCGVVESGGNCDGNTDLPQVNLSQTSVTTIFSYVFGLLGAIAVVFMLIAGIRLITSAGDPNAMTNARQTLIFAAIGLVVAVSAEVVINYVLQRV